MQYINPLKTRPQTLTLLRRVRHLTTAATTTTPPPYDVTTAANPPPDDAITAELTTILSRPNWQTNPSLLHLINSLSSRHVITLLSPPRHHLPPETAAAFFNFLSLHRPVFRTDAPSHFAVYSFLRRHRAFALANKARFSMIVSCAPFSPPSAQFVLQTLIDCSKIDRTDEIELKFVKLDLNCYNYLLIALCKFCLVDELEFCYKMMLNDMISPDLRTFNTMISCYCKLGDVVKAEGYYKKILRAGFRPSRFTDSWLVLGFCRRKTGFEEDMTSKDYEKIEESYNYLIHGLCEEGRVDEGLKLFGEMEGDLCLSDVRTYTVLIDALCRGGRWGEGIRLFDEMREKGFEANGRTYTVLIDCICKERRVDEARKLFDEMAEKGVVRDVGSYNVLIDGYCKQGKVDSAFEILNIMEMNDCCPNVRTCNELIRGLCGVKKVSIAMSVLDKMLSPNLVTYNFLIRGHCDDGRVDVAFRLLDMMQKNGVQPDVRSYTIIINALCRKGDLKEAHCLFDSLKEKGVKADEIMFGALIDGYCKMGQVDYAYCLVEKMKDYNCVPNSHIYNMLIDGLCREKRMPEVVTLIGDTKLKPDLYTYSIIINGFLKDGSFDGAHKILKQMLAAGFKPDACIHTSFISAFCKEGNLVAAEEWMEKMKNGGVSPDAFTYNVLIDGYGHLGLLNEAFVVLKFMLDASCEPSQFTFSILIKHLLNENNTKIATLNSLSCDDVDVWKKLKYETVMELMNTMIRNGCIPNINTYTILVGGLCKGGQVDVAKRLMENMKHEGLHCNESVTNSVIKGSCKLGMFEEALDMIDDMVKVGKLPRLESFFMLICGLYDKGKKEHAERAFLNLLRCGYNNDEIVWKILIDGLLKRGHVDGCSQLLKIMETNNCHPTPHTYLVLVKNFQRGSHWN